MLIQKKELYKIKNFRFIELQQNKQKTSTYKGVINIRLLTIK